MSKLNNKLEEFLFETHVGIVVSTLLTVSTFFGLAILCLAN